MTLKEFSSKLQAGKAESNLGREEEDRQRRGWMAAGSYRCLLKPANRSSEQQKKHFNDRRVLVPGIQH